ncbi:MAG: short-chain dehydrogenase, partial [Proteobacteria bacterium]|nr:short-chain dehydrogenase [Pseudomonadota bacterium]
MSNGGGFSGGVYIVTGSTQGIGAEVALSLARAGAGGIVI